MSSTKNKTSFIVLLFIVASMLACNYRSYNQRYKTNPYPIAWDVYGYYLYLPATFIYQDPGLENNKWLDDIHQKYHPSPTVYQYTKGKGNKQVIIYNIGYSFVYAPGFFIAHYLAKSLGFAADGFSKPYQLSLVITAFIFTLIGLFMFRKIALHFFSDKITAMLLIAVIIGTNYFFQVTYNGTMPHNILFTLNCFIIWFTIKWYQEKKPIHIVLLALFLGLASICRPTELIWILLPLFWGVSDKKTGIEKINVLKKHVFQLSVFAILLFFIVCIQLFYLKYATGYFRAFNLHSERFSFFDPYTFQFLFSYKKGWLVYTPIMIFAIMGFYFLRKHYKTIWFPLFLFFAINLYVVSSWECWWYAASFSQRPMVETYCLMLFPMGALFTWILENKNRFLQYLFVVMVSACVALNIFQSWQFLNYIIDPERMTKEYYWKVFGKTSVDNDVRRYLSVDRNQTIFEEYNKYSTLYVMKPLFKQNFEKQLPHINQKYIVDTTAASGKQSFVLNHEQHYSPEFRMNYYSITNKSYLWIRASVNVYLTAPATECNSALVVAVESKGKSIKYLTREIKSLPIQSHTWTPIQLDFLTPEIRHRDDKIIVYYWNMENKPVLIDDLQVEAYEPKIDYK